MDIEELAKTTIDSAQKCYQLLKVTGLDKSAFQISKNFTSWFSGLFKGRAKEKIKYLNESKITEEVRIKIIQLQGNLEDLLFENDKLQEEVNNKIKELKKNKDIELYKVSINGDYNNVIKNVSNSKINIINK